MLNGGVDGLTHVCRTGRMGDASRRNVHVAADSGCAWCLGHGDGARSPQGRHAGAGTRVHGGSHETLPVYKTLVLHCPAWPNWNRKSSSMYKTILPGMFAGARSYALLMGMSHKCRYWKLLLWYVEYIHPPSPTNPSMPVCKSPKLLCFPFFIIGLRSHSRTHPWGADAPGSKVNHQPLTLPNFNFLKY